MMRDREVLNSLEVIDWGVAVRAKEDQSESGDRYLVKPRPGGVLLAVVDGLGHGEEAVVAAKAAVEALSRFTEGSLISLVKQCHQALESTRGVVMTLVLLDAMDETMTWLGIGNVEGMLMRATPNVTPSRESALLRGGVVGYQLPVLRASVIPVTRGDTLVLATDGIRSGFSAALSLNQSPQKIADQILTQYGKDTDDALILVARYLGRTS